MIDDKLRRLQGPEPAGRYAAYEELVQERKDLIRELMAMAEGSTDPGLHGSRALAIVTLGEYRAAEAVPFLTQHLDFLPAGSVAEERKPTQYYYPSVWALCQIGHPAFARMLQLIETSADPERRHLAAWVLFDVEGRSNSVSRLLERAAQRGGEAAASLRDAARYLETYVQTYHAPQPKLR